MESINSETLKCIEEKVAELKLRKKEKATPRLTATEKTIIREYEKYEEKKEALKVILDKGKATHQLFLGGGGDKSNSGITSWI